MNNYITLKFGTLKSWDFTGSEKGAKLLSEYDSIGSSLSLILQKDTRRQKEIICELIDLCDEESIFLDWDGEGTSKEKAKQYVMSYGAKV